MKLVSEESIDQFSRVLGDIQGTVIDWGEYPGGPRGVGEGEVNSAQHAGVVHIYVVTCGSADSRYLLCA